MKTYDSSSTPVFIFIIADNLNKLIASLACLVAVISHRLDLSDGITNKSLDILFYSILVGFSFFLILLALRLLFKIDLEK